MPTTVTLIMVLFSTLCWATPDETAPTWEGWRAGATQIEGATWICAPGQATGKGHIASSADCSRANVTFVVHPALRILIHDWMTQHRDQFKGGYEPSSRWVRSIADEVLAAHDNAIVVRDTWTDADDSRGRSLSLAGMPLDDVLFDQLATTLAARLSRHSAHTASEADLSAALERFVNGYKALSDSELLEALHIESCVRPATAEGPPDTGTDGATDDDSPTDGGAIFGGRRKPPVREPFLLDAEDLVSSAHGPKRHTGLLDAAALPLRTTSLMLLVLQSAGTTPGERRYQQDVRHGLDLLASLQHDETGRVGPDDADPLDHILATAALVQAANLTPDDESRQRARRACEALLQLGDRDTGGWLSERSRHAEAWALSTLALADQRGLLDGLPVSTAIDATLARWHTAVPFESLARLSEMDMIGLASRAATVALCDPELARAGHAGRLKLLMPALTEVTPALDTAAGLEDLYWISGALYLWGGQEFRAWEHRIHGEFLPSLADITDDAESALDRVALTALTLEVYYRYDHIPLW